jgi:hypothetical protein
VLDVSVTAEAGIGEVGSSSKGSALSMNALLNCCRKAWRASRFLRSLKVVRMSGAELFKSSPVIGSVSRLSAVRALVRRIDLLRANVVGAMAAGDSYN